MSEEQENNLLDFLASLGFDRREMEGKVKQEAGKGEQTFRIKHNIAFGREMMFFDLHFNRDYQFNAYRLEWYKATHRAKIPIRHSVINGVDTAQLETRMAIENWGAYLKGDRTGLNASDERYIQETINMLNKLPNGKNFNGMAVQESLMFKYWPKDFYDHPSKGELEAVYEESRDFKPLDTGFCNTNLAYYIVSGKLQKFYESLYKLNLDTFPGADVYDLLDAAVSNNPGQFYIAASSNEPEGFIEFRMLITIKDYELEVRSYHVKLTPHAQIETSIINGIDTGNLEALMQQIDWKNKEAVYSFDENRDPELVFTPKVYDIMEQMHELNADKAGAEIVMQLQLKYYRSNDFLSELIEDEVWEYLSKMPYKEDDFSSEIEVRIAFNLLCGRAVIEEHVYGVKGETEQWLRLDGGRANFLKCVDGIQSSEIERLVSMLPIKDKDPSAIRYHLQHGNIVPVKLKNDKTILLEINPEQYTIDIYNENMQPIPFNIEFNPDWKQTVKGDEISGTVTVRQENRLDIKRKISKGKRL